LFALKNHILGTVWLIGYVTLSRGRISPINLQSTGKFSRSTSAQICFQTTAVRTSKNWALNFSI